MHNIIYKQEFEKTTGIIIVASSVVCAIHDLELIQFGCSYQGIGLRKAFTIKASIIKGAGVISCMAMG